jgi:hypothetical protein
VTLQANERASTLAQNEAAKENSSTVSLTVKKTCQRVIREGSGRKILCTIDTVDMSMCQC